MSRDRVKRIFTDAAKAFSGDYRDELTQLLAISHTEIASLTPGTADYQTYLALIKVVEDASRQNLSQADLVGNIKKLGDTAIKIVSKVPKLLELF